MSVLEITGMFVSFGGVSLIAIAQSQRVLTEDKETSESIYFPDNESLAGIVGCCLFIFLSICNGVLAVMTRSMQSIHVSVMMSYIAIISFCIMTVGLLTEKTITGDGLRIANYTEE